jgi:hypothetical protein
MDSADLEYGPVAGFCINSNEPSCSIKGGEFRKQFGGSKLLLKGAACMYLSGY